MSEPIEQTIGWLQREIDGNHVVAFQKLIEKNADSLNKVKHDHDATVLWLVGLWESQFSAKGLVISRQIHDFMVYMALNNGITSLLDFYKYLIEQHDLPCC